MHRRSALGRAAPPGLLLAGAIVAVAGLIAGLIAGCTGVGASHSGGVGEATSAATATASASESADAGRSDPAIGAAGGFQNPQLEESAPAGRTDAQPVRVRIPGIGVDSGLEALTRDAAGWIEPPTDFGSAGWYRDGVVPGQLGPAVIAGHIDSVVGPAVFYDLVKLTPGDTVQVELADGSTVAFRVDRSIQVPKNDFPTEAVYGPTPDAQLRLVTCGGTFDDASGHYVDNVVVFATKI
ncbi:class F sortase [Herbiconiux sp. CPCC 205763]|uniref:Class F sortase n=1 Tax=Herbiconiux aconitum TaxID=2970913 RepID=A0ABT2GUL1_9MICO|nr:class F sortase [Herbiconiux aconitum]MCS5719909.1 class F sortase [Herbiconiux aconitum]